MLAHPANVADEVEDEEQSQHHLASGSPLLFIDFFFSLDAVSPRFMTPLCLVEVAKIIRAESEAVPIGYIPADHQHLLWGKTIHLTASGRCR